MKNIKHIIIASLISTLFACSSSISQNDVVQVKYSKTYWDNNSPKTYYLIDKIYPLDLGGDDGISEEVPTKYNSIILGSIKSNMEKLGYTASTTASGSDLIVGAMAIISIDAEIDYDDDDWFGWDDWGDDYFPSFGGDFIPEYYSWSEGTIVIEMGDGTTLDLSASNKIDIVWGAGINGLIRNSLTGNRNFIQSTIDKAFEGANYLKVE